MIWVLGLHGVGSVGTDPAPMVRSAGLGGTAGLELSPRVRAELLAQGTYGADRAWHGSVRPELRVTPRPHPEIDLALTAGYGLGLGAVRPQGSLGLSLERGPVRIDARWMVAGLTPEQAQLAIGWTWGRPPEPQPVPLVEAPVVQAPAVEAPVLDVSPADALVWVPHPYCRWMTVAEASLMLGELPADLRLQILAGGYLPGEASPGGELSVALDKAPEQASLVVAAQRGDEVRIGEATVPSANGAVVATVPLRDLTVTVIGGGRTEIHELSPADGYVLWVRTDGAAPLRVQFPVNSSTLQPAQRAEIAAIAAAAGHWSFQVQGGASPEGDAERNRKLADARGQAVAAALIEAGLDPERVEYLPSIAPTSSDQAFEVLRFATVTPIAPESP